jgi:hypothetical protein
VIDTNRIEERRERFSTIDRIVRGIENAWKIDPDKSFGELLSEMLMVEPEDPIILPYLDDVSLELALRQHLAHIMRSSREA